MKSVSSRQGAADYCIHTSHFRPSASGCSGRPCSSAQGRSSPPLSALSQLRPRRAAKLIKIITSLPPLFLHPIADLLALPSQAPFRCWTALIVLRRCVLPALQVVGCLCGAIGLCAQDGRRQQHGEPIPGYGGTGQCVILQLIGFGQNAYGGASGGSFGTVYKAIEKDTGDIVAIKHVSGFSCPCISFFPQLTICCSLD